MAPYRPQSRDTSEEVDRLLMAHYRAMTPVERIAVMRDLCRASQEVALAGLRHRHPEADENELRLRLAATRLSPEIMRVVFGWTGDAP